MSFVVLSWTSSIHPIEATEGEDKNIKIAKVWRGARSMDFGFESTSGDAVVSSRAHLN